VLSQRINGCKIYPRLVFYFLAVHRNNGERERENIVLPILGPQGANKNTYKDRNSKLIET